jgi:hypothetical protein
VVNGPRYQLALQGTGYRPRLHLSFTAHDFGPVSVWRPGMEPACATLRARNDDAQAVAFEVLWGDKEHLTVGWGVCGVIGCGDGGWVVFSSTGARLA